MRAIGKFTYRMVASLALGGTAFGQVSVTTYHNNLFRTGANFNETILKPSNVSVNSFGKLFQYPVDGQIYAQPLYMPKVTVAGKGVHNVVFIATEHDSVYAFDADSNAGSNATYLWHAVLANSAAGVFPVTSAEVNCSDITPEVGITGTPVIDASNGTLYVVTKTAETTGSITTFHQRLHALDIRSGAEKFGGPFDIQASVAGSCPPNSNGRVTFDPLHLNQRAGLLLNHGVITVTWASHCDNNPYTGWAMAFNAANGKLVAVFNTAPNAGAYDDCRAGIWQGGAAPAADGSGNIYLATGNGFFDADSAGVDYGDSVLKLGLKLPAYTVNDYFTPYDEAYMDANDKDLGSGGVVLLPDQPGPYPHLLISVGKEGSIYLVNRDNMGGYNPAGDTQIVQKLTSAIGGVWGVPAYFQGTAYFGGQNDSMKAFTLNNGLLSTNPTSRTSNVFGYPGTTPSVSASGTTNGIVWALDIGAWNSGGPAILRAYPASNLATELYDSAQNASRDQLGPAVKFSVPTVANGKVYVGTGNSVAIFGLL